MLVGLLFVGNCDYIKCVICWWKMIGGGMCQFGILAVVGIYVLKNNVVCLQEDYDNAVWMVEQLCEVGVDVMCQDINMLFVCVGEENAVVLGEYMKVRNVLINVLLIVCLVMYFDVLCE